VIENKTFEPAHRRNMAANSLSPSAVKKNSSVVQLMNRELGAARELKGDSEWWLKF
jgi:hypothetical protein